MKLYKTNSIRLVQIVITVMLCLSAHSILAQANKLMTRNEVLEIDKRGVLTIRSLANGEISAYSDLAQLWKLTLKNIKESNAFGIKNYDFEPTKDVEITNHGNVITLSYKNLKSGTAVVQSQAIFRISVKDESFCFSSSISNADAEWLPREITYPILTEIKRKGIEAKVFLPSGLGQCFENPAMLGSKSFDYPSGRGTMQWLTINTGKSGFYLATHDESRSKKRFNIAYSIEKQAFSSSVTFPIFSNSFESPEITLRLYHGKWFEAAKYYRSWYDTKFTLPSIPLWVKQEAGWLLAILKQQNGYVMWKYHELDQLCDIATQNGLKTIGLFGWANGGHDYLYPNYIPDDLLGGRAALKAAIERAHKKGIRIVLYANGTLIDASTEFYRYEGNNAIALQEDKSAYTSSIRKYNSSTPVVFAEASYSSKIWRETMLNLALQAHDLGADGILYDQVGVKNATLNFSTTQDHKLPQESGTKFRYIMMNEIRTRLKNLNPDFVVMTEGVNDAVLTDIDYFHGWGDGTYPAPNAYPGLFKYTFPELVKTQRHGSPMLTRYTANFAAVTGQRHELETRWEADVNYLKHGILPNKESYKDEAYFPPSVKEINEVSPDVARKYLYDLIAFENKHAEFFRTGRYIDEEGITGSGEDIVAKGFKNRNRLGVVVWNNNKNEARAFQIDVPGYSFLESAEPEANNSGELLNPNSIRLLIYQQK